MPKREDIRKIMLIGSGPIVIGQACEFDYSGVQACKSLKAEGYEVVLVNSNPATIMTDPDFADRTYIEPLTAQALTEIIRRERPDALLPTLGGQTALNLAMKLAKKGVLSRYNVEMIGALPDVINKAEDRELFKEAMIRIGLDMPRSVSAHSMEEAREAQKKLGCWPVVIRPGFTLGGTGGGIAHDPEEFEAICQRGLYYSPTSEENHFLYSEHLLKIMTVDSGRLIYSPTSFRRVPAAIYGARPLFVGCSISQNHAIKLLNDYLVLQVPKVTAPQSIFI